MESKAHLALVTMPNTSANEQSPRKKTSEVLTLADVRKRNAIEPGTSTDRQPLLIHGLTVEQYRAVYNTVVKPWATKERPPKEDTSTALGRDLKHKLWVAMDRPRLEEVVDEDGRVEVRETFDPL